ncbi:MAG: helix-turn-helix domain-containing protein, partial [Spirochaetales bacterium]|nr:helix-turn-helix domain-containing protein [Spirochaetales bacterium]
KDDSSEYFTYFSHNNSGEPMKSTTIAIRGSENKIIGLLCINFFMNTTFADFTKMFIPQEGFKYTFEDEFFAGDISELLTKYVNDATLQVRQNKSIPQSLHNKEIINILQQKDIFKMKNAVNEVAKLLDISINTVYFHLRSLREQD